MRPQLGVPICISLILWAGFTTAERKTIRRAQIEEYMAFQRPYLEAIAPIVNTIQTDAMHKHRVGWDEIIEADYVRQRERRADAIARRARQREIRAQQVDQEEEEEAPRPMRFEDLMEQDELNDGINMNGDPNDEDDEDDIPAGPIPPSLTTLLDDMQPILGNITELLEEVDYDEVPFIQEAQRLETGIPFNYRLINEEARDQTIKALERLENVIINGTDGWDIEINEMFAVDTDEYHRKAEEEVKEHSLLSMLERLVLEINQSWVFGHDLDSVFAYLYSMPQGRGSRVLIDLNGPLDYANSLQAISGGVGAFMAAFTLGFNNAFKFLPKRSSGPWIEEALGTKNRIIEILEFYHKLVTKFYTNVRILADRPFGGTVDEDHAKMVRQRQRNLDQQANALEELNQMNQDNQAALLNQFNQQNQGNRLNGGDFTEQLGRINLDHEWDNI
ncbi:hypothetical protein TWF191_009481 [Orbilia oligospora]|uniref:Uncharacterized protein n=2 Tax=Orbilia oligospora TaxID=2813651 RepID=A0A7C8V537_ORBOL|nr:hypothetical protein TWF191_009481 [Orbilia oligospora]